MSSIESFEHALKEVVTAKRLSASKMNKLTDIAMSSIENDTGLVSSLYRMHKTLGPSSKIHSLYVFDALSRAARSKVNKLGLTGDINAEKGNCATFLLKIDGILDALIQDMMSLGTSESKEKTKKILDIWTKNNTFPSSVLTRLTELTKDSTKKDTTPTTQGPTVDPRLPMAGLASASSTQAAQQQSPIADTAQAQALLQAILSSAVSSVGDPNLSKGSTSGQINTNIPGAAGLQVDQVALLQQLVEKAKSGQGNGTAALATVGHVTQSQRQLPSASQAPLTSYNSHSYESATRDSQDKSAYQKWDQSTSSSSSREQDWQGRERGGWRGGGRGISRGGYSARGGKPWRDDDRDGPSRRRRSRSRSPQRYSAGRGGGPRSNRDIRPYSPPRRPPSGESPVEGLEKKGRRVVPDALEPGKDEFGRDIRQSASPRTPPERTKPIIKEPSEPRVDHGTSTEETTKIGLNQIDFSKFDFASPTAWATLGRAWQMTHGSPPTQEQLMQLVMGGMSQPGTEQQYMGYDDSSTGHQSGRDWRNVPQPGKSIPTYESGSNMDTNSWHSKTSTWHQDETSYDYEHGGAPIGGDTDAVVLGGEVGETQYNVKYAADTTSNASANTGGGGGGGGMKRIGDKWVWQAS